MLLPIMLLIFGGDIFFIGLFRVGSQNVLSSAIYDVATLAAGLYALPAMVAAVVGQSLANVSAAAILIGGGFAFMHSTLQTWATEVVPEARATVISLFAAALFAGSGVAAIAAAPLAGAGSFSLLFALAALVAIYGGHRRSG